MYYPVTHKQLIDKEIISEIRRLSIPNIISNISVPLLGIIDLALMGHLGDAKYIGAIALGSTIFNLIYWAMSFLRMGTSGFTSQAFGQGNFNETSIIINRGLIIAAFCGVLLIATHTLLAKLGFYVIKGEKSVETLAEQYFRIRVWAAPATIGMFVVNGWLIGMQNSRIPMLLSIAINIFNLGFNLLFIFVFKMKSEGVAYGTLLAQYIGFAIGLTAIFMKYKPILKKSSYKKLFITSELKQFFTLNANIFLRTLSIIAVFTFFNVQSASYGNTILAVNALLIQFLMFFSYFSDGIAYATEALTGRFIGAKEDVNTQKTIQYTFFIGGVVALIFSIGYFFGGTNILRLLTSESLVIQEANKYIAWIGLIPILSISAFIWDGAFVGATASAEMRNSTIFSAIVFFGLFYTLKNLASNHALWIAMISFMLIRGLVLSIYAKTKWEFIFKTNPS